MAKRHKKVPHALRTKYFFVPFLCTPFESVSHALCVRETLSEKLSERTLMRL
jgi:hypothetical protein